MSILFFIILIMFGPPIIFTVLGSKERSKNNKDKAKIFYIIAAVYLLVGLGVCGYTLNNLSFH